MVLEDSCAGEATRWNQTTTTVTDRWRSWGSTCQENRVEPIVGLVWWWVRHSNSDKRNRSKMRNPIADVVRSHSLCYRDGDFKVASQRYGFHGLTPLRWSPVLQHHYCKVFCMAVAFLVLCKMLLSVPYRCKVMHRSFWPLHECRYWWVPQ
jgi:hypothetical protein